MKEIYLLTASSGSYDTYESHNVKAFFTQGGADAGMVLQKENDKTFNGLVPKLQTLAEQVKEQIPVPAQPEWPERPEGKRKEMSEDERKVFDRAMRKWTVQMRTMQAEFQLVTEKYHFQLRQAFDAGLVELGVPEEIQAYMPGPYIPYIQKIEQDYYIEVLAIE